MIKFVSAAFYQNVFHMVLYNSIVATPFYLDIIINQSIIHQLAESSQSIPRINWSIRRNTGHQHNGIYNEEAPNMICKLKQNQWIAYQIFAVANLQIVYAVTYLVNLQLFLYIMILFYLKWFLNATLNVIFIVGLPQNHHKFIYLLKYFVCIDYHYLWLQKIWIGLTTIVINKKEFPTKNRILLPPH